MQIYFKSPFIELFSVPLSTLMTRVNVTKVSEALTEAKRLSSNRITDAASDLPTL